MPKNTSKYLFSLILFALFLAQFLFISPKGEFALNDDWVQTDTIKYLAETGQLRLMPYAGATFYIPALYGALLIKLFGFSFTLLRLSTLVLGFFILYTLYFLLLKLTNKPSLAFLDSLLLWPNPIFYNLSFTFMTDIPALFFLLLSMYFYYAGFEKRKNIFLFLGTVFGLLSTFTRQTGILIIFSALLYNFINFRTLKLKQLLISFGLPLAMAGAIYTYLNIFQLLPQSTWTHIIVGGGRFLGHIKWWLWYVPMYLGLFTLPLTLGWFIKNRSEWFNKKFWIIFGIISGLTFLIRQIWHLQFPYIGNIISYYGLGPMKTVLDGKLTPLIPSWAWGIITMFCALGFALLIFIFSKRKNHSEPAGFIYLFGLLYLIPIFLFESFDRYFLPLLVVLIIALAQQIKHTRFSYTLALLLILISGFFSLTQTKFYLAWNQARWDLAEQAVSLADDKTKIDAGYEWDGWNNYWSTLENEKLSFTDEQVQTMPWWKRRFFPDRDEQFIISFSKLDGFEIMAEKTIEDQNPNNHLYLLKRE